MTSTNATLDAAIAAYLSLDLLVAAAEERLPLPPRVPAFAAVTVPPRRPS